VERRGAARERPGRRAPRRKRAVAPAAGREEQAAARTEVFAARVLIRVEWEILSSWVPFSF